MDIIDLHCAGCGAITSIPPLCRVCFATIGGARADRGVAAQGLRLHRQDNGREAGMTVTTTEETAMEAMTTYEQEAYELGRDAALSAASWVIDGNTEREHIARVVGLLDDGDPRADDFLPPTPNLSGEWADDPTPLSLAREITGDDDPDPDVIDALADAFDRGVDDHFVQECERILRAAL